MERRRNHGWVYPWGCCSYMNMNVCCWASWTRKLTGQRQDRAILYVNVLMNDNKMRIHAFISWDPNPQWASLLCRDVRLWAEGKHSLEHLHHPRAVYRPLDLTLTMFAGRVMSVCVCVFVHASKPRFHFPSESPSRPWQGFELAGCTGWVLKKTPVSVINSHMWLLNIKTCPA